MNTVLEHVLPTGGGYYIAGYATRIPGSNRFLGYAKVCHAMPRSYWEAPGCFAKFSGESDHATAAAALTDAMEAALMSVRNLGWLPSGPQYVGSVSLPRAAAPVQRMPVLAFAGA